MNNLKKLSISVSLITIFLFTVSVYGKKIHNATKREGNIEVKPHQLKITILYDNYVYTEGTKSDWGFACIVEGTEKTILFDTGTKEDILFHNVNRLKIDLKKVKQVVISHNHGDHTGGLFPFLKKNKDVIVYVPNSFPDDFVDRVSSAGAKAVRVKEPLKLSPNVFLTGEMGDLIKEHSMVINTPRGLVIVNGCSHPGIIKIIKRAKEILKKKIYLVFGGFHLMRHSEEEVKKIISEFKKLGVVKVGATHCTGDKAIQLFKEAFKKNYVTMGVGKVINVPLKK